MQIHYGYSSDFLNNEHKVTNTKLIIYYDKYSLDSVFSINEMVSIGYNRDKHQSGFISRDILKECVSQTFYCIYKYYVDNLNFRLFLKNQEINHITVGSNYVYIGQYEIEISQLEGFLDILGGKAKGILNKINKL